MKVKLIVKKSGPRFRRSIAIAVFILIALYLSGQKPDTLIYERFSFHGQSTIIEQFKPSFKSDYTGRNSLLPGPENKLSVTSTLFLGARLWKNASFYLDPEIGGGSGLSGSLGVAASANGETYRIGNPTPQFELARIYFSQVFPLSGESDYVTGDFNKIAGRVPSRFLSITVGKLCVADNFDVNIYSHDPRTQFMSWALMSNGAWDYPANTRGYTPSLIAEYVSPVYELRYGFSLVPKEANGMAMNWDISISGSHTIEYTRHYNISGMKGSVRILAFFTRAEMGNYNQSLIIDPELPDITSTRKNGRTKFGFGFNAEQTLSGDVGLFLRTSWNDGNNETWVFTEIDRSVSLGISINGRGWKRENDNVAFAIVSSGLSSPHRNYLKAGGYGFELGDGNLNYGMETLAEFYYSYSLAKSIYLSAAYQFINNPGYNKARGPVNVFSIRVHTVI